MGQGDMGHEQESKALIAIAELKGLVIGLDRDMKALQGAGVATQQSVDALRGEINGRFKKLEHAVFGNEETEKVGLVEKVRGFEVVAKIVSGDEAEGILPMPERLRNLESGWAKLTTAAVLACSVAIEGVKWAGHLIYAALASGKTH